MMGCARLRLLCLLPKCLPAACLLPPLPVPLLLRLLCSLTSTDGHLSARLQAMICPRDTCRTRRSPPSARRSGRRIGRASLQTPACRYWWESGGASVTTRCGIGCRSPGPLSGSPRSFTSSGSEVSRGFTGRSTTTAFEPAACSVRSNPAAQTRLRQPTSSPLLPKFALTSPAIERVCV